MKVRGIESLTYPKANSSASLHTDIFEIQSPLLSNTFLKHDVFLPLTTRIFFGIYHAQITAS